MISSYYFINRSILLFFLIFLIVFTISNASASAVANITQLTYSTDVGGYGNPAWSPDGLRIAYSTGSINSNNSIWVMNANGSNQIPLTRADINNPVHRISAYWVDSIPRWSPDGSKIAFQRTYYYDGGGYNGFFIYIINADGTNQMMLISGLHPSISPNGKYIAFDTGNAGGIFATAEQGLNIFVMRTDGTDIKRLTDDKGNEASPSWSPDGSKIVFTKSGTIYIMDADGSNKTSTGQVGYDARWSPDGKHIAFISERAGDMFIGMKLFHIYIMEVYGVNATQLTFGNNRSDGSFDWSPDSTRIIFGSAIPPKIPTPISNLYVMTLDFNATPTPTLSATQTPEVTQTSTVLPITTTPTPGIPGFSLIAALVSLSIIVLIKRKRG